MGFFNFSSQSSNHKNLEETEARIADVYVTSGPEGPEAHPYKPQMTSDQRLLLDYRSRGIYVLAVYVNGDLWNYFYYPSREKRSDSISECWDPHFSATAVPWDYEYVDPD